MLASGTKFAADHAVRMVPRRSAATAIGRQRGLPRIGSENSPRDADGSPRNSGAPWRRATPLAIAPACPAFAGAPEPRLLPPAAREEATGAPHAAVPGEYCGSREVSGEQRGRQRCRCNRWAVRVALTCPSTSSTSSKRMLLGRPVRVKGAGYNRAAHNRRKHSSERLPGECIEGQMCIYMRRRRVSTGAYDHLSQREGVQLTPTTTPRCSRSVEPPWRSPPCRRHTG